MGNSYWEKMTAKQRSAEMSKRRRAAKVYNHPGGSFNDPETAKQASLLGVEKRRENKKTSERQDSSKG